jgi:hypothetical protein
MYTLIRRSNNNGQQVGGQAAKTELFHRLKLITSAAVLVVATLPGAKASDITFVDQYKNLGYDQTGNGNTLTATGGFFSAEINANASNAYTSANLVYPGPGSPQTLPIVPTDSTVYHFQTTGFATKAAMDAAFPVGTYTYNGINGGGTDSTDLAYSADHYATSLPYLTGTDFSSLLGMNTAQAFTFHFSPFTGSVEALPNSSAFIFFTIFDLTKGINVFDAGFLPTTATGVTIGANTLTAGDTFRYELDFSNRFGVDTTNTDFAGQLGFDERTDGTFTAAAATTTPEPSTMVLLSGGLLVAAFIRKRKRSAV